MERESFEDAETAALMNELFVNVKVDREERPDVDQIYMDTVVRLHGHGGWPLTVFCTPDGRPVLRRHLLSARGAPRAAGVPRRAARGGARLPRAARRGRRDARARSSQALRARPAGVAQALPGARARSRGAARELLERADREHGGFGGAPKFPTPTNLELLLAALRRAARPRGRRRRSTSSPSPAARWRARGLYDQLGGGFHRYCVDDHWGVPHFEKMLYDQGQLLRVYAEVWRRSGARDDDLALADPRDRGLAAPRDARAPTAASSRARTPTARARRASSTSGRRSELRDVLGAERGDAFCAAYGVTPRGQLRARRERALGRRARGRARSSRAERAELLRGARASAWRRAPTASASRPGTGSRSRGSPTPARCSATPRCSRTRSAPRSSCSSECATRDGRLLRVYAEGRAEAARLPRRRRGAARRRSSTCTARARASAGSPAALAPRRRDRRATSSTPTRATSSSRPSDGERLVHRPRSDHDGATPHSTGLAVLGLLRAAELAGRTRPAPHRRARDPQPRLRRSSARALAYPTLAARRRRAPSAASRVAVIVGEPGRPGDRGPRAARAPRARSGGRGRRRGPRQRARPASTPSWLEGRAPRRAAAPPPTSAAAPPARSPSPTPGAFSEGVWPRRFRNSGVR